MLMRRSPIGLLGPHKSGHLMCHRHQGELRLTQEAGGRMVLLKDRIDRAV
jgi:hypothetical protein